MNFVLWARRKLSQRTALCILPNQERADRFAAEIGDGVNVHSVWNCPTRQEISPLREPYNGNELWILYHGSIVPSRLPLTILETLAILPEFVKLRVIGYETLGHKGYVKQVQEMASQLGIRSRVDFLGAMPTRSELFKWCQKCDIGVALMPRNSRDLNEQTMSGASNKPFDYMACGLALLVSDLPDWRKMYLEPSYGLTCDPDDPENIASALRWFVEHPQEMREMGERGRQRVLSEWNYERQFLPVLQCMEEKM